VSAAAPIGRARPIPPSSKLFSQPPPPTHYGGFGGSSGPGHGGTDFWNELAQFGIYPNNASATGRSVQQQQSQPQQQQLQQPQQPQQQQTSMTASNATRGMAYGSGMHFDF
jgi:hypothetical protein